MTEQSDPYENLLAERMNGTLKEEFGLGQPIKTKQQAILLNQRSYKSVQQITPIFKMKTPN